MQNARNLVRRADANAPPRWRRHESGPRKQTSRVGFNLTEEKKIQLHNSFYNLFNLQSSNHSHWQMDFISNHFSLGWRHPSWLNSPGRHTMRLFNKQTSNDASLRKLQFWDICQTHYSKEKLCFHFCLLDFKTWSESRTPTASGARSISQWQVFKCCCTSMWTNEKYSRI